MGRILLLGVGGIVAAVVAFKLLFALIGTVLGIVVFVLFRVVPLILIGWFVLMLWRKWRAKPTY